ncbi:uncharacterized protein LOC133200550 [Saccostrea echinata]|uniref:uncharacterized protein LOC133200550 n=1 Tax=Saccostrea echinata TaxID=191078 RepID=UPI002A82C1D9|nr:uncharacterized protein LOC133200550 [Saccostrea echinata]
MSLKVLETNEADRSRKRTASDLEEDKDASLDMEHETLSSCKASMQRRKKHAPSSSSEYSTWSEDEDEADSSCLKSRLASYNSGNFSASELTYKDLLNLNIIYEDMPEPLEKFIEEVKDAFRNEKGFTPDPGKITNILKKQLEKSLTFSYDMRKIEKLVKIQHRDRETENVKKEVTENIEMTWKKMDALFDYNALKPATEEFLMESVTLLNVAVRDFAQETLALMEMGKFLEPKYPLIEKERGKRKRRGERSRGGQEWSHGCYDDTRCAHTTENICLHYVRSFGKIFFLKEG